MHPESTVNKHQKTVLYLSLLFKLSFGRRFFLRILILQLLQSTNMYKCEAYVKNIA